MASKQTTVSKTVTETTTQHQTVVLKPQPAPKEKFRKDYKDPEYYIKHVQLDFTLDEKDTEVKADLFVLRSEGTPAGTDLILDGEDIKLQYIGLALKDSVVVGDSKSKKSDSSDQYSFPEGRELKADKNEYQLLSGENDGRLLVSGKLLPAKAGELFKLSTRVRINPSENLRLSGLYKAGTILCTQCEAEGFRRITYYLDRPDVMATFKVRLEADKSLYPVLLTNGDLESSSDINNNPGRHEVKYNDPVPKPAYLFAIVAGDLAGIQDEHKRPDGRPVKLNLWCEPKEKDKLDWAMQSLKLAMKWDEDTFGLIYDLDVFHIVAVRYFNMGAMENKSLNIFNSALLLATRDTASDSDFLRILGVVGHEYFHNWTGNRVTCRDWFQLTLKEGLTVYRDQEFSKDMGSRAVARIENIIGLRAAQYPEDSGPMAHPIRPESYLSMDNFYTSTVYQKGAEVIRMYETLLTKAGFRKGMDLYFKRHDGKAVTCDDFRAAMADANDFDFTQFERWYLQAGTPVVELLSVTHDEAKKTCHLKFKQTTPATPGQPTKQPFLIPITVGLIGKTSKAEIVPSKVLQMTDNEQEFVIEGVGEPFVPSILRNLSAPVKLVTQLSDDDYAFLMAYDTDPFNKWEAGQKLATKLIIDRATKMQSGELTKDSLPAPPELLVEGFRNILTSDSKDLYFKAFALSLPGEDALMQEMNPCYPREISDARTGLRSQLYKALSSVFDRIYDDLTESIKTLGPASESITPENIGRRQLRNLCLGYRTIGRSKAEAAIAFKHFTSATCMTDKLAAFRCLVDMEVPEREQAIQKFYDDAKGDDNVVNKWFAIQALADTPDTLDKVKKLKTHKDFDITNPNRLRSVVTHFALNRSQFHRKDGKGYEFIADNVVEVDKFNGSIAARLCNQLIQWRRFPPAQQEMMKSQLQRILQTPELSKDTFEIASKGVKEC